MMDGLQKITGFNTAKVQSTQQSREHAYKPQQETRRRTYQPQATQTKPIGQWIGGGLIGLSLLDFAYNAFFKKDETSLVQKYIIPLLGAIIGFVSVEVSNDRRTAKDTSFGHSLLGGDLDSGEGYDVAETLAGLTGKSVEEEEAKNRETAQTAGIQIPREEVISSDDLSKEREITSLQDVLDELGFDFKTETDKGKIRENIRIVKSNLTSHLSSSHLSSQHRFELYCAIEDELVQKIPSEVLSDKEVRHAMRTQVEIA